jgi:Metal-dependent hydrolases of the beta-lactamase superfamily I
LSAIHILASGSKANAYIIEAENSMLLIDQGLSFREFSKRAEMLGIDISRIKGILLTHEHEDHIKGVAYTAYKLDAPVFSMAKTLEVLDESTKHSIHCRAVEKDRKVKLGAFEFTPFEIMHDAVDPVGYLVSAPGGETVCFATDTGKITNRMMTYINQGTRIILEANHDPAMLYKNMHYPQLLKERIRGQFGHLSNEQSLEALERMGENHPKTVIFSHLSEENNSPKMLKELVVNFRQAHSLDFKAFIANQYNPLSIPLL